MIKRSFGRKIRQNAILVFVLIGLLLAGAAAASAYFTDRITASVAVLHTGMLRLEYPAAKITPALDRSSADDRTGRSASGRTAATPQEAEQRNYGIVADFSALDGQIYPYQKGDSIALSFRTQLSGDSSAYIVPKISIHVENQAEGDRYTVYESSEGDREYLLNAAEKMTETETAGDSTYYGQVRALSPGEEQQFCYRISLDQLSDSSTAAFTFDFSVAAVQQKNNRVEELAPAELYQEIRKKEAGDESWLCGFTDVCGRERMIDTDGSAVTPERGKQIFVELKPQITEGAPAGGELTWYRSGAEGEEKLNSDADGSIRLLLNGKTAAERFRYEIRNKAGIQVSPRYYFEMKQDGVHCRKEDYVPDFSAEKARTAQKRHRR